MTGRINRVNIHLNEDLCKKCGLCVKECPVSALTIEPHLKRNQRKCLYCYHCVHRCPTKAITGDVERMKRIVNRNKHFAGEEAPFNVIY
ncbi:MAG: 4Fe-4S binding protein [Actinomycetia bacterium]|nr:4Fe-4S binding protein [Actinomycetes bacterium]